MQTNSNFFTPIEIVEISKEVSIEVGILSKEKVNFYGV